jgi:CDP-6-deoxy-D-xylo-4-hexulose-3-dehydrase
MKNFSHPLMENNISKEDINVVIKFLKKNKKRIFTQSEKVLEFEKKWSKWLGVKYSVFVNSGSSANYLTMTALKILYGPGEVIVPPLTWSSDIVSVINNNFKPIFVDINLSNLSMNIDEIIKKINNKTKAIFLTHAQGFNGLNEKLLKIIKQKKIILIEDVCESHGAHYKNKKLGTFGLISNFSFYYAHHLSTIEGGMVCTNNKKIYETIKMLRGHGMLRECGNKKFENGIKKKYKTLSPKFIFLYPGFNMRNTEIGAVIGLNQLKRLSSNNKLRAINLKLFLANLNQNFYYTNYDLNGNSNYAFPIILKKKNFNLRDKLEKIMHKHKIEFRRGNAGGGNQLRQPYLKKHILNLKLKNFKNVEQVHHFGYYIGNFPQLKKNKILNLTSILNKISKTNFANAKDH